MLEQGKIYLESGQLLSPGDSHMEASWGLSVFVYLQFLNNIR